MELVDSKGLIQNVLRKQCLTISPVAYFKLFSWGEGVQNLFFSFNFMR